MIYETFDDYKFIILYEVELFHMDFEVDWYDLVVNIINIILIIYLWIPWWFNCFASLNEQSIQFIFIHSIKINISFYPLSWLSLKSKLFNWSSGEREHDIPCNTPLSNQSAWKCLNDVSIDNVYHSFLFISCKEVQINIFHHDSHSRIIYSVSMNYNIVLLNI